MNLLQLSAKSLQSKPAASGISLLLLSLGVAIISLLFLLQNQVEEKFNKNISGIDMVVGAKGSPLQLILSAVFQLDNPTGNISLKEAKALQRNRLVAKAIPLAYGDSYQGFRIVGTEESYLSLYESSIARGKAWNTPYEVVLGSQVAKATGLEVGDTFYSAHGLVQGAPEHDEHPFVVSGILEHSNSVLDGLILTGLETVWQVHAHSPASPAEEGAHHPNEATEKEAPENEDMEITAMLIKFRGPMGMVMLPRQINERSNMQAAVPAIEVNRLFQLLGIGVDLLKTIAYAIIFIAGFSFFLSLYNSLRERKYELALMRSMGASRSKIFSLLLLEGLLLSLTGYLIGILIGHLGLLLISNYSANSYGYQFELFRITKEEIILAGGVLLLGIFAATIPAIKAIRTPISETLSGS